VDKCLRTVASSWIFLLTLNHDARNHEYKKKIQSITPTVMKVTNKMQIYRLIYYSLSTLHVSGDVFPHHQEHLTVFTVSGGIHAGCCRLVPWLG
jgi:hypothetical protein